MSPANVGSDRLALTRLEARHDESSARLAYHTSGAYPSLSRALFLGHG
jgi:hypothetical protein